MPTESPNLGPTHLQFEALLTAARLSPNRNDFALVTMLGLLGLRIFETCGADITDLGKEHGRRVLRVRGKGDKTVLIPLPPAVSRAIETARSGRDTGPILRSRRGVRMDRHCATRRLRRLAAIADVHLSRMHPHICCGIPSSPPCSTPAWTCDVQIAARHVDPRTTHALRQVRPGRTSTGTRTTSSPPTWPPAQDIPRPDLNGHAMPYRGSSAGI